MAIHASRALFCIILTLAWDAAAATNDTMKFRVWLGEREIGSHDVTVSQQGEVTTALSKVLYNVKILFVNAFSYEHEAAETWQGNCLASVESFTRENGRESRLVGRRAADTFVLSRNDETVTEQNDCLGTYAYWDMQRIRRNMLMNPQTGDIDAAQVVDTGLQPMPRLQRDARSYRIDTDQSSIQLWYSEQGRWLALETEANGKPLIYLNEVLL